MTQGQEPTTPLFLDPRENTGYLAQPLPVARDTEICAFVSEAYGTAAAPNVIRDSLSRDHASVLLVFGERMASLAVRRSDPSILDCALKAVCLALTVGNSREGLLVLPLLWHSAELLRLDAPAVFDRAGREGGCLGLTEFAQRRPEDQTIESMGYVEDRDAEGFRYRRTW